MLDKVNLTNFLLFWFPNPLSILWGVLPKNTETKPDSAIQSVSFPSESTYLKKKW
jgi:hypothetical protein